MRQSILDSQAASRARSRQLLFSSVCSSRAYTEKKRASDVYLPSLQQIVRAATLRGCQEPGRCSDLLTGMLVRAQPARAPLLMGRRARRTDEPGWPRLEESGHQAGSWALPPLHGPEGARGPSHPAVRHESRSSVGHSKRHHALSRVSPDVPSQGRGICPAAPLHRGDPAGDCR